MKKPLNFDLLVEDMGVGMSRTPTYTGAPEGIRTLNLLIRSQALCPIELRGRIASFIHQTPDYVKKLIVGGCRSQILDYRIKYL